jgi:predicted DNA-binding transcriptional regulator AlpA
MVKRATPADDDATSIACIGLPELCKKVQKTRWTIWRLIKAGKFPKPVFDGRNKVWRLSTIDAWMKAKKWR